MLTPPLYLRLTDADTGTKFNLLLSLVHQFNTEEGEDYVTIRTFHATAEGVVTLESKVKETEEQLWRKIRKVLTNYHKLAGEQFKKLDKEDWQSGNKSDEDDDDEDPQLYA